MSDYIAHFGLKKAPFSTTPDPAFAFATREHQQALAKIAYYTEERRGIFLLLGEVGTGKTTISQLTINRWRSEPNRFLASHITQRPAHEAALERIGLAPLLQLQFQTGGGLGSATAIGVLKTACAPFIAKPAGG